MADTQDVRIRGGHAGGRADRGRRGVALLAVLLALATGPQAMATGGQEPRLEAPALEVTALEAPALEAPALEVTALEVTVPGVTVLAEPECASTDTCWDREPVLDTTVHPAGLLGVPGNVYALSGQETVGAQYVRGSNVLVLPGGQWRYLPAGASEPVTVPAGDAGAEAQIAESRAWLASGTVPGSTPAERELAERALLDLRLLVQDNGAMAAAWHGIWRYSWPRDSVFAAAALAATGHDDLAESILGFLAGTQRPDGTWEARVHLDGSGPPDERPWQLDANGWVPWAVWQVSQTLAEGDRAELVERFYPMVAAAADYAASSLDGHGLPPARPDYWESAYPATSLGTAAPLLAGLLAAARLAQDSDRPQDAARWREAADALATGLHERFGRTGYQRTASARSGADSAIAWLAPPFVAADEGMWQAIGDSWDLLVQPTGGIVPGQAWSGSETWTPETMFFALAWAGGRDPDRAASLVAWLADHRTAVGTFPEKVTPAGEPAAVAPLGWTASLALLTLSALEEPLPLAEPEAWPSHPGSYARHSLWPEAIRTASVMLAIAVTAASMLLLRRGWMRRRRSAGTPVGCAGAA